MKDNRLFRNAFFLSAIIYSIIMVCSLDKRPQSSRVQEVGQCSHAHGVILGIVPCGANIWPDNPYESLPTQAVLWFSMGIILFDWQFMIWMTWTGASVCSLSQRAAVSKRGKAIAMSCFTVASVCACLGQLAVQWSWFACSKSRALYLNRLPREAVDGPSGNVEGQDRWNFEHSGPMKRVHAMARRLY